MRRLLLAILTGSLLLLPGIVSAQQTEGFKNKGLLISPVREYVEVQAGSTKNGVFTVVNSTDKPMDITFSVESFSVNDYTYDYRFEPVKNDWIMLGLKQVKLQPAKSQRVPYAITTPEDAPPGGHYYTLFATTAQQEGGVKSQVRAAMPLYLTISGNLIRTSTVKDSSIKRFVLGKQIPFSLSIQNTGNVHYFANVHARLSGPFAGSSNMSVSHLLMPGTTRDILGSIPSPRLPGIYKATYGYTIDNGDSGQMSEWIVYLPPWSLIFVPLLVWGVFLLIRKLRDNKNKKRAAKLREKDPGY